MIKTMFLLFLLFLARGYAPGEEIQVELLLQEALYEEYSVGNIQKAMDIYNLVLKGDILEETRNNVRLRLGLCYEKLGETEAAQNLYYEILRSPSSLPEVLGLAQGRMKALEERRVLPTATASPSPTPEIKRIPEVSTESKAIVESKTTPTDGKIAPPADPKSKEGKKEQKEPLPEDKVGEILASHLYKVGKNLHQQGFLLGARENLKKSLSFQPKNKEVQAALEEVEALISEQEKKAKDEKNGKDNIEFLLTSKEKKANDFSSSLPTADEKHESGIFSEKNYDVTLLFNTWKIKDLPKESVWSNALLKLLRHFLSASEWVTPSYIKYQNQNFIINQTMENHARLTELWQKLGESTELTLAQVLLFSEQNFHFLEGKIAFTPQDAGVYYSFLESEIKTKLLSQWQQDAANFLIEDSTEIVIPLGIKIDWQSLVKIPLVQGYKEQSLHCKIYREGVSFVFHDLGNKLILQVLAKTIQKPIPIIPGENGPLQIPCFLNQQTEMEIALTEEKNLLIGGLLNPYPRHMSKENRPLLFAMVHLKKIPVGAFLQGGEETPVPKAQEEYIQSYDVEFLQKIEDSMSPGKSPLEFQKEERNPFILKYFRQALSLAQKKGSMEIFRNFLVVVGNADVHSFLKERLSTLRENKDTVCKTNLFLFSCDKPAFAKILKNWNLATKKGDALQLDSLALPEAKILVDLRSFSEVQFVYKFSSFWIGNTQQISLKNCRIQSFMENRKGLEDAPLQAKVADTAEGVMISLRPILTSAREGVLQVHTFLSKIESEKETTFSFSNGVQLPFSIPQVNIVRFQISLPLKEGQSHLVYGLPEGEAEKGKILFFLFFVEMMDTQKEATISGK